jgi:hypothetical protein
VEMTGETKSSAQRARSLRPRCTYLSIYLAVYLSMSLYICVSIYLYIFMYLYIYLSSRHFRQQNHSEVFVLPVALSPKTVFSTSFVSGAVFLSAKQSLTQRHFSSNQPLQKFRLNATVNACWEAMRSDTAVTLAIVT